MCASPCPTTRVLDDVADRGMRDDESVHLLHSALSRSEVAAEDGFTSRPHFATPAAVLAPNTTARTAIGNRDEPARALAFPVNGEHARTLRAIDLTGIDADRREGTAYCRHR